MDRGMARMMSNRVKGLLGARNEVEEMETFDRRKMLQQVLDAGTWVRTRSKGQGGKAGGASP